MSLKENLKKILNSHQSGFGWDVVIVTAASSKCAEFWKERFEKFKGAILSKSAQVITVVEDFGSSGAGNGLGTLYAWKKACEAACEKGWHLEKKLQEGFSVALFHTAGLGMRMYPLTAVEEGIKPAIRLPSLIHSEKNEDLITLLEAIIRQTSLFANSQKGRFSVFWGDQVFIPSKSFKSSSYSAIEIYAVLTGPASEKKWKQEGFDQYGVIVHKEDKIVAMFEKCSYEIFKSYLEDEKLLGFTGVAKSLGSFSLSYNALQVFLEEFKEELASKTVKFDSDFDFWMPLLLSQKMYIKALLAKGHSISLKEKHYQRMQDLKKKLISSHSEKPLFSVVDIGQKSYWWDYGTVWHYYKNNMKLTKLNDEGFAMRSFFGLSFNPKTHSCTLNVDGNSDLIQNSVVIGVKGDWLEIKNSLVLGSFFKTLKADGALAYKVRAPFDIELKTSDIAATVSIDGQTELVLSDLKKDPKSDWDFKIKGNLHSWAELAKNQGVNDFDFS